MKKIVVLLLSVSLLLPVSVSAAKPKREKAVFRVEITCQGCVNKIEKNIAFEKGVKDLLIDKDKQVVTVVYDPLKTDKTALKKAFAKIRKPVLEDLSDKQDK